MVKIELTKAGNRELVKYTGTRSELLDSGVAEPQMLPCTGYMRLFRPQPQRWDSPGFFQTSRRGEEFVLTRWRHWQLDPAQRKNMQTLLGAGLSGRSAGRSKAPVISLDEARRRRER